MLLVGVTPDAVLEHDPSVKVDVGALFGHRECEVKIVLGRLVKSIDAVAGPLIVGHNFAGDHVCLAGVGLEGVDVVLDVLQVVLNLRDHLRRCVIHLVFQLPCVIRIISERFGCQKIRLERADCGKIGISDIVLDGHLSAILRIIKDLPGRRLFSGHDLRIIDDTRHAPHVACRIAAPGFSSDLVLIKHSFDVGGDAVDIVVILIRGIKEAVGERNSLSFPHKLHDHIFRGADQIILIAKREHVVEVFVGAECGVFHFDRPSVGLFIPDFKVLDHGILADDIAGIEFDGLLFVPVSQVNILFPVAHAQDDRLVFFVCRFRPQRIGDQSAADRAARACTCDR